MPVTRFLLIIFLLALEGFRSFAIEPLVEKDTVGNESYSFCRDSVFSFRSKKGFVPELVHDFGEQAVAPFHMMGKQVLVVTGAVAITGALFFVDENIDHVFKPLKDKNKLVHELSKPITDIGSSYGFVFAGAFGGYGLLFKDGKAVRTMLLCMQAAITAGAWARVGKVLTGRERPSASYSDFQRDYWWGPFQEFNPGVSKGRGVAYFDAFPSGHTTSVFSIASVFAHQYNDKKFVPVVAYAIASLVGISRLTEHDHWASDVFAGACIGYLCGKQVVKHEKELSENPSHASRVKMKPDYFISYTGNQVTLNCAFVF